MSVSSVDLEMQSPTHPLPTATSSDEEEGRQCWREVEAETGFSSYMSFLKALPETGPQFEFLRRRIGRARDTHVIGEVHVLDILEDGGVSTSMKIQKVVEEPETHYGEISDSVLDNSPKSCTQLLRNLRSPPENIPARIVAWSLPRGFFLPSGLVDAIGLGLKIQPAIFDTLLSIVPGEIGKTVRRLGSDHVIIGNSVATVARNYRSNERVPPVLLVARVDARLTSLGRGFKDPKEDYEYSEEDYDDMVKEALTSELYGSISLCHPASDMRSLKDLAPKSYGYLNRLSNHVYLNLLSKYVQKGAGVDAQSNSPLLNAILPLLHLEVLALRPRCEVVRNKLLIARTFSERDGDLYYDYKQRSYQGLDEQRFWLRRKLEGLEKSRTRFVKFARLQHTANWLEGQPWMSQEEEMIGAINEARAQEAEARDYMQLEIGNLSILESRKSIQLSSQQMSEAKRVKIFTILAFIYVPINLATSVFGMNLQQLNHNGQNFWSFVVTAIGALLITGFVWFSLELYDIVVEHKHLREPLVGPEEPKVRIGVRVAILLGLIKEIDLEELRRRGIN